MFLSCRLKPYLLWSQTPPHKHSDSKNHPRSYAFSGVWGIRIHYDTVYNFTTSVSSCQELFSRFSRFYVSHNFVHPTPAQIGIYPKMQKKRAARGHSRFCHCASSELYGYILNLCRGVHCTPAWYVRYRKVFSPSCSVVTPAPTSISCPVS